MTNAALLGPASAPDLHVMTLNIRRPVRHVRPGHPDSLSARMPRLRALLREERPSLLAAQEALPGPAEAVRQAFGTGYRMVGTGRGSDRHGESCPIFYDVERLELLRWRQSWLSDRPDQPGSIGWGNLLPRIVVAATMRDRATSAEFVVVNTHFDHLSRRSRLRSARAVRGMVARQPLPTIVMGDLNSGADSEPLRELLAGGVLVDAWHTAADRLTPEWGTYARYRKPRPDGKRLDWILTSPGIEIDRMAIRGIPVNDGWASDHLPVQAVLRIPGTA
jgi:endonuclease/exonuclease/phosphatase family metal-dependent hydrolase